MAASRCVYKDIRCVFRVLETIRDRKVGLKVEKLWWKVGSRMFLEKQGSETS